MLFVNMSAHHILTLANPGFQLHSCNGWGLGLVKLIMMRLTQNDNDDHLKDAYYPDVLNDDGWIFLSFVVLWGGWNCSLETGHCVPHFWLLMNFWLLPLPHFLLLLKFWLLGDFAWLPHFWLLGNCAAPETGIFLTLLAPWDTICLSVLSRATTYSPFATEWPPLKIEWEYEKRWFEKDFR